tara:strand:+ start:378 stop:644 length:267 start_codon:yes stop_codon:yes gene_type:complete
LANNPATRIVFIDLVIAVVVLSITDLITLTRDRVSDTAELPLGAVHDSDGADARVIDRTGGATLWVALVHLTITVVIDEVTEFVRKGL